MTSLIQFTAIRPLRNQRVPVWINPARITFVEPRFSVRGREEIVVGTRVHFGSDTTETFNAVLDLVEEPGEVIAMLAGPIQVQPGVDCELCGKPSHRGELHRACVEHEQFMADAPKVNW